MEAITQSIIEYLNNNHTLGALQIDGPWGCGKTYYIKNVLLPIIEQNEIERERNAIHEKRLTLMISLFGIKNIDEISRQLLFASIQSKFGLSQKRIDGIKKSFANIAKCVPYLKEIDWDNALQIPPSTCLKLLGDDAIIILDDLERLSKEIDVEDVLGFVNDLVENYNFKVILVSNQEHFEDNALLFKEKVIDKTIPFEIDTSSIIKSIAGKFHPLLPAFIESEYVVRYINHNTPDQDQNKILSNLRTIRFAISQFYPFFDNYTKDIDKFENIPSEVIKKLCVIWRFTLVISIEYRLGHISPDKSNDLENAGMRFIFDRLVLDGDAPEKTEQTYEEKFIKRYYDAFEESYLFIPEIYNYILKGGVIDFAKVNEVVSKELGIWEEPMNEEWAFVSKFFGRISHFSDVEAPSQFIRYLDLISKGYIEKLSDIINSANILFCYKDVIGLNTTQIENEIIKGIDAFFSKTDIEDIRNQEHHLDIFSGNIREEAKLCLKYIYDKIKELDNVKEREYIEILNEKFAHNLKAFAQEFSPSQVAPNVYFQQTPILHLLNLKMVEERMRTLTPEDCEVLYDMLYYRFENGRIMQDERSFVFAIQNGLKTLSDEDKTLSAHFKRLRLIPLVDKVLK